MESKVTVYGLRSCDTCRKALKWLSEAGVDHRFVDLRRDGLSREQLEVWVAAAGWESLLNRRGTTWRGLPDSDKAALTPGKAAVLMQAHPALIKRPVFAFGDRILVGFDDAARTALLGG